MWVELMENREKMIEGFRPMALDTFGKRLRVLRVEKEMSQIELRDKLAAVNVTIGETYISELERTAKMPSLEVAAGMARVLDVSLDYLGLVVDDAVSWRRTIPTPDYFSHEADEVARMVDEMHPAARATVLNVARGLAAQSPRQAQRSDIQTMLRSVERDLGTDTREQLEKILRGLGMLHDPDA